jgi:cytoskeletal protein CcmA (bactofilin family)
MAGGTDRKDAREAGRAGEAALTIVATGTRIVGEVLSNGVVKVEGEIAGTVRADRQVLVARGGVVEGDVHSAEAVLGGEVRGGVFATERVEVQTGAAVHGDIATKRLIVQEGAEVNGLVKMADDAEGHSAQIRAPAPQSTPQTTSAPS